MNSKIRTDETCSTGDQHLHSPEFRALGVLEQVVMRGQVRQTSERLSNLWSRKFRRRVGSFPLRWASPESIADSSVPDLVNPYGWGVSQRQGTISIYDLRRLDPTRTPDQFRQAVQAGWAVIRPDARASTDDEVLLRCAASVGTPAVESERVSSLCTNRMMWEQESFRQWSEALDRFRLEPHWNEVGRPAVTITLPTRRPELLDLWTAVIAAQTYRPLQVVVGLHGSHWSADHEDRISQVLADADVTVVFARVGDDAVLGDVLNATVARADGDVLVKWDDDDLYSTNHVMDLLRVRHYSGATIVGKAAEFVYLQGADRTIRRDQGPVELFSPTLAGGTLAIDRRDIVEVGGWGPLRQGVDAGIISRVRRSGGTSYRTAGFGYLMIRRANSSSHTWQVDTQNLASSASASSAGLATDWAMIDVPELVTKSVARGATDGQ